MVVPGALHAGHRANPEAFAVRWLQAKLHYIALWDPCFVFFCVPLLWLFQAVLVKLRATRTKVFVLHCQRIREAQIPQVCSYIRGLEEVPLALEEMQGGVGIESRGSGECLGPGSARPFTGSVTLGTSHVSYL